MRGLWLFLIFMVIIFTGLAIGCVAALHKFGIPGLVVGFACYTIAWFVAELVGGAVFYTYAKLTVKSPGENT
jgi:hypothetical protein